MLSLERADGTRRVGLWSLVGLLLLPLVVAGGFLAATWKSDARLDRVQAAVVNLDEPVTIGKQTVPLGRQLAGGLVNGDGSDQNFSWLLTDGTDAAKGLESGRYAAVVTIPRDFSANATSYSDQTGDTAERATLDVQTSQVTGIADPVVGQAITAAATRALNSQLTEGYLQNIYVGFNDTKKQFTKVADAAGTLSDGTRSLADGIDRTASGTAELADGLDQLDTGGAKLADGAVKLSSGVSTLAEKTSALPAGARKLADGASGFAGGLETYQRVLEQQAAAAARAPQPTAPSKASIGAALAEAAKNQGSAGGGLPSCAQIDASLTEAQCGAVLAALGATAGGAYQQGATAGVTVASEQFGAYLPKLATYAGKQGASRALAGAAGGLSQKDPKTHQSLVWGASGLADGVDQLADGLTPLAAGIQKLADGTTGLSDGITTYTNGVHTTSTGTAKLSDGVAKLATGGDKLADGTKQLADGLAKGADQIPTYDASTRQKLSEVVAAPVSTPAVHSAFSNVATTTLLAVLALWVGALAAFVVLRAVSARALSSMKPSWRLTLEALAPAAVVAAVQSVVLTVLLTALLDLTAGQTVRLLGLALLAGLTFAALNQALAAWFGGVGRFVSVVLVVASVAGAMTSAVPAVFDTITPLLPLTPALQGMRAVVTGADGVGGHAGLLLAWLVVGLSAAVLAVARRRVVRTVPVLVPALDG